MTRRSRSSARPSASLSTALIVMSLMTHVASARAQTVESSKTQAQAALREGNVFLGQGRATDALMKFTEAYRLFPSPKLHYNMGQAHSLIPDHEAQAYQSMGRFLAEAVDANSQLRAAAETQQKQLRPKVGLVSVTADPADADLLLDDVNVGRPPGDSPLAIGIGTHRLSLKKNQASSETKTVTIAGGDSLKVSLVVSAPLAPEPVALAIPREPSAPPSATVALAPPAVAQVASAPADGTWTWQRKVGSGLAGLAVAGLALGIVEHLRYFGKKDDFVNAGCGTMPEWLASHPECQRLNNQFKSANTWWVVGYVGAAVFGGAGAYFLWIAPGETPSNGTVASVGSSGMVNFRGRF